MGAEAAWKGEWNTRAHFLHESGCQTLFLNWVFSGRLLCDHGFVLRICCALGEETVAKYKFLLHEFFSKVQNAFSGQFVGNKKGMTLCIEKRVLCVERSHWQPVMGLTSAWGIAETDSDECCKAATVLHGLLHTLWAPECFHWHRTTTPPLPSGAGYVFSSMIEDFSVFSRLLLKHPFWVTLLFHSHSSVPML